MSASVHVCVRLCWRGHLRYDTQNARISFCILHVVRSGVRVACCSGDDDDDGQIATGKREYINNNECSVRFRVVVRDSVRGRGPSTIAQMAGQSRAPHITHIFNNNNADAGARERACSGALVNVWF